jgi:hypothetical protein
MGDADCTVFCKGVMLLVPLAIWIYLQILHQQISSFFLCRLWLL